MNEKLLPPSFCPFFDPDSDLSDSFDQCECVARAGDHMIEGASCFCMGKVQEMEVTVGEVTHRNDYMFCVYSPHQVTKEMQTVGLCVNKTDMEALHSMIHLGIATRGFMVQKPVSVSK